jgi:DNA-binding MarR family transcriptional regulator
LICLRQLLQRGGMTPGQLAREVSLSPATISGILDRLESRALITRQRRLEDKRQVLVQLTDAGRQLVGRTPLPLHERFVRRLAELPANQQAEIEKILGRIVEMMEAEGIDAAPLLDHWPAQPDPDNVTPFVNTDGDAKSPGAMTLDPAGDAESTG